MAQGARGGLRLELVPTASCPLTDTTVRVDPAWRPGTVVDASCGHRHRATFAYGTWALEEA